MIPALTTTQTNLIIFALVGAVIVLLFWGVRLEVKMRRLLLGKDARSLEDSIVLIKKGHQDLERFRSEAEEYLRQVEQRLRRSIQGVETIRFNPFKGIGAGGNQSFSTAFLNEDGDGVVISTLYARDRMSFFSKPVKNFVSSHELSDEEKEVIKKAKGVIA